MRLKDILMPFVVILVVAIVIGALSLMQQRPFVAADAPASSRQLEAINAGFQNFLERIPDSPMHEGKVILVHFWNPACLCNSVSMRHVRNILATIPEAELRFIVLLPEGHDTGPNTRADIQQEFGSEAIEVYAFESGDHIPLTASPGLAVFSPQASLAYYGAYGFGALCSLSEADLFTSMIASLSEGNNYGPFINIAGSGCFCPWPGLAG